jgi:hypothetical protein
LWCFFWKGATGFGIHASEILIYKDVLTKIVTACEFFVVAGRVADVSVVVVDFTIIVV